MLAAVDPEQVLVCVPEPQVVEQADHALQVGSVKQNAYETVQVVEYTSLHVYGVTPHTEQAETEKVPAGAPDEPQRQRQFWSPVTATTSASVRHENSNHRLRWECSMAAWSARMVAAVSAASSGT